MTKQKINLILEWKHRQKLLIRVLGELGGVSEEDIIEFQEIIDQKDLTTE